MVFERTPPPIVLFAMAVRSLGPLVSAMTVSVATVLVTALMAFVTVTR